MKRAKQIIYLIEATIKMSSINNNVAIEMANDVDGAWPECKNISISALLNLLNSI